MTDIRFPPLPPATARATESAFGNEHPYLKIGRRLEDMFFNLDIAALASSDQNLVNSLWPYALATILQYCEDLTDFQMADATRTRLDLKYALHLSLNFPGFEPSSLCRFRQHLLLSQAGKEVFQKIAERVADFVTNEDKHSINVDVILSNVCTLRQWEIVTETMSNAIESLAASHPEWLRSIALPHWFKRYGKRVPAFPSWRTSKNLKSMILSVGQDGQYLLDAVEKSGLIAFTQMHEIQILAKVWQCQFNKEGDQLRLYAMSCSSCPGVFETTTAKNLNHP